MQRGKGVRWAERPTLANQSLWLQYAAALGSISLAIWLRWLCRPWLGESGPFLAVIGLLPILAVTVRPGPFLSAAVVGFLGSWLMFIPSTWVGGAANAEVSALALWVAISLSLTAVAAWLSRTGRERARVATDEIERQREQFRTTLGSIGDGVVTTDLSLRVEFMNGVAEGLTGWTCAEGCGRPISEVFQIICEKSRLAVESPAAKVLSTGQVVRLPQGTALVRRDGSEIPIDDSAAPIRTPDGGVSGVVLVFRDARPQRDAEIALGPMAAIVEASDDAIVSETLEGVVQTWNAGAERLFGYRADEMIGRSINVIIPEELREQERSILERLREGERFDHFETMRESKNGTRLHIWLTISPIRDKSGAVIGASSVARDVTERLKRESDARFLADASRMLANLVDYQSTLKIVAQLAVPNFADWCSVDMLEASGTSLQRVAIAHVDPNKVQLAQDLQRQRPPDPSSPNGVWRVIRSGKPELVPEITQQMIDESPAPEQVKKIAADLGLRSYMAAPLAIRGKVLGVISFVSAESGRRYGESDLAVAEDLANRAAIAIENSRLYQEARQADRRKDEFLATLALELMNPLAPIRNALAIRRRAGANTDIVNEASELMERQVDQMVHLVDDLLDVSRITRDKLEMRMRNAQLGPIIEQSLETVRPLADRHNQLITTEFPSEVICLVADPVRLGQVFSNLFNNACKFSDAGDRIRVKVVRVDEEVVISVQDDGIGMPPDQLDVIFDMFSQVEQTKERSRGGLGIGLTLVKRIVQLHGGQVSAFSGGLGKGSEFTVRLPVLRNEMPEANEDQQSPRMDESHLRVMIVDDNEDAATSMATLLRLAGNVVETAHGGLQAVQAYQSFGPQVMFLDIGLPDLNGHDVCRVIRQSESGARCLIIAMTGWGQEEDKRRSGEAGFDFHLVKPVAPTILMKLLAEHHEKIKTGRA